MVDLVLEIILIRIFKDWLLRFAPTVQTASLSDAAAFGQRLDQLAILAAVDVASNLALFSWFSLWPLAVALAIASVFLIGSPLIYRRTGSIFLGRETFLVSLFIFLIYETLYFGTFLAPSSLFLASLPVVAVLAGSFISAIVWIIVVVVYTIISCLLEQGHILTKFSTDIPKDDMIIIFDFGLVCLVVSLSIFVVLVDYERRLAIRSLRKMNATVRELAISDPLTGVFNRRHLADIISADDAQPVEARTIHAVFMIDIDRFKSINDTFGHMIGDTVIRSVASAITEEAGSEFLVARFGGEEFVCIMKALAPANGSEMRVFAESVRRRASNIAFDTVPSLDRVTVSIGFAQCSTFGGTHAALAQADSALYVAKQAGRNCVREALDLSLAS